MNLVKFVKKLIKIKIIANVDGFSVVRFNQNVSALLFTVDSKYDGTVKNLS